MCVCVCVCVPGSLVLKTSPAGHQSPFELCAASRLTTWSSVRLLLLPLDCWPITICNETQRVRMHRHTAHRTSPRHTAPGTDWYMQSLFAFWTAQLGWMYSSKRENFPPFEVFLGAVAVNIWTALSVRSDIYLDFY